MDWTHGKTIILGSGSPRRKELLTQLGLTFTVRTADVDETAPAHLNGFETAIYVAELKANTLKKSLQKNDVLITADTEVWQGNERFGKPNNHEEARKMLEKLSGKKHMVISGVTFTSHKKQHSFWVKTDVTFKSLQKAEIDFYLTNGNPLDKAGAYGIQEWIGLIGIAHFSGSYTNVVGLPMTEFYSELSAFIQSLPHE